MLKTPLITIIAAAGIYILYLYFFPPVRQSGETQDYLQARQFLASRQYLLAYQIANQYSSHFSEANKKTRTPDWLDLAIEALENLPNDASELLSIYRKYPQVVLRHERAAQITGAYFLSLNDIQQYREIRKSWTCNSRKPEFWVVLDADEMVLEGKRLEAVSNLNSHAFEGVADVPRLLRLSLLASEMNPKLAWEYFNLASKKDPDNPELGAYRAKILEAGHSLALEMKH